MPTPAATALADQVDAATADARQHLAGAARQLGAHLNDVHKPHPWLAAQVRALLHALNTGQIVGCPHISGSPQVLHAAVWRPGIIACSPCSVFLLPADPGEDTTCDRCRVQGRPMHSNIAAVGPIFLGYGLCAPCQNEIHVTANHRKDARR